MTNELKERIAKIRNGKVPKGYKNTVCGIIPEGWSLCRLKKKFSRLKTRNSEGNTNVLTISAQYGLINQEEFFKKEIASDDKSNYFLLKKGDFAYNKSYSNGYPYGAIKTLTRYDKGIVSPLYICFSPIGDNLCTEYYSHYFEFGLLDREIHAIAQEGARNHGLLNINVDDFFNTNIILPHLPEQQKIAEILSTQDKVIELLQKKIEELQKLKKAYLQKMFPKKGEVYPEIRFKGFTDAWEQRELGSVFTIRNEKNGDRYSREDVLAVSDTYGCVNQIKFHGRSFAGEDISNYKVVRTGDIVYTKSPLQAKPYGIIKIVGEETGIVSPLYVVNETVEDIDSLFMYYLFDTPERTNNYLSPLVRKGAKNTMNISNEEWLSGIVTISSNEQEQKQIGTYFRNLDHLITLHQRELEQEKQKKKALMQLLLTGIVRVKV
ncbi:MAG: restriction endonuclease subunit S [Oscillospiraceae bacterium]